MLRCFWMGRFLHRTEIRHLFKFDWGQQTFQKSVFQGKNKIPPDVKANIRLPPRSFFSFISLLFLFAICLYQEVPDRISYNFSPSKSATHCSLTSKKYCEALKYWSVWSGSLPTLVVASFHSDSKLFEQEDWNSIIQEAWLPLPSSIFLQEIDLSHSERATALFGPFLCPESSEKKLKKKQQPPNLIGSKSFWDFKFASDAILTMSSSIYRLDPKSLPYSFKPVSNQALTCLCRPLIETLCNAYHDKKCIISVHSYFTRPHWNNCFFFKPIAMHITIKK